MKATYEIKRPEQIKTAAVVYPFTYINPYQALPPIAAEYLQAGLDHVGIETSLIDMRYEPDMEAVREKLESADLICFHGHFEDCSLFGKWHIHVIPEVMDLVPEDTPVFAGGTGFLDFEESFAQFPKIDVIVRGNPEIPAMALIEKGAPKDIDNLVYRQGKKTVANNRRIHDLPEDIYPRRRLRNPDYKYHAAGVPIDLIRAAVGCNYKCKFCYQYGKDFDGSYLRWKGRSAESLYAEISEIEAPIIALVDDDMTTDMKMLGELSQKLIDGGQKKLFGGTGRIDHVVKSDIETLKKMERAGFVALSFGVESLKNETLKFYGKGQTIASIEKSMKMMAQTNILLICNFILGSPGETEEDMMEMLYFGRHWNVDSLVTNRFHMQKEGEMYRMIHDPKTKKVKPGMERIDGDELLRIKNKIKFGQRTPLRILLTILKLYRHRGMFYDPFALFISLMETSIRYTWLEKTLVFPLFLKTIRFILLFPPVRFLSRVIAILITPFVKGLNWVLEWIDRKTGLSTSLLPRIFLYLKEKVYKKQQERAQVRVAPLNEVK